MIDYQNEKMNVIEEKDKLLSDLCRKGKTCTNFISGYSEELASELESNGYIRIVRQINYEEAEATELGIEFYRNGGFKGEAERKNENEELKKMQLEIARLTKLNLQLQNNELNYNKRTRWISWIALLFGIIGTIVAFFK